MEKTYLFCKVFIIKDLQVLVTKERDLDNEEFPYQIQYYTENVDLQAAKSAVGYATKEERDLAFDTITEEIVLEDFVSEYLEMLAK